MNKRYAYILINTLIIALVSTMSYADPLLDNQGLYGSTYNTGISPGLELLIDRTLLQKKTKQALTLLDDELQKDPTNTTLLFKKASIYANLGQWSNASDVLEQIKLIQPGNKEANQLRIIVDQKKQAEPHNEIGFNVDEAYVSDLSAYWNFTSLHYYRLTDGGKFGGHINYAKRYGSTGIQYQLEAYPEFSQNVYAALSFSYANTNQILYPNLKYMMEVYVNTIHNLEFSLGQGGAKYITFSNQKIFNYTGTIGKYIGNSFIWLRPRYFTPKQTMFFELGLRKYFSDTNNYVSVVIGNGRLPDIGDVPPLDQMIIIKQTGIGIKGQLSVTKTVFLQGGVGYANQAFPSGLNREITDASVGIIWRI